MNHILTIYWLYMNHIWTIFDIPIHRNTTKFFEVDGPAAWRWCCCRECASGMRPVWGSFLGDRKRMWWKQCNSWDLVGFDPTVHGLYFLYFMPPVKMVIWWMVYDCFNHITLDCREKREQDVSHTSWIFIVDMCEIRWDIYGIECDDMGCDVNWWDVMGWQMR